MLKLLVEKGGADLVHAKRNDGFTPLHWACIHGRLDSAQCLVSQGADIEAKISDGWTPLLIACCHGHLACAQYLVSVGADIDAKTFIVRPRPPADPHPSPLTRPLPPPSGRSFSCARASPLGRPAPLPRSRSPSAPRRRLRPSRPF